MLGRAAQRGCGTDDSACLQQPQLLALESEFDIQRMLEPTLKAAGGLRQLAHLYPAQYRWLYRPARLRRCQTMFQQPALTIEPIVVAIDLAIGQCFAESAYRIDAEPVVVWVAGICQRVAGEHHAGGAGFDLALNDQCHRWLRAI